MSSSSQLQTIDWGELGYEDGLNRQQQFVEEVASGDRDSTLVFCTHPPVVTLGRATGRKDLLDWSGEVIESNRGGRATYHGPNQQVIYPIIDLNKEDFGFQPRDLKNYLRFLENKVIDVLGSFGIEGRIRDEELFDEDGDRLETTGVWVDEQKVASIGIAVRKWVAYHGIAVNLYKDESAFTGIRPCGFSTSTMTSIEALKNEKISREEFQKVFTSAW